MLLSRPYQKLRDEGIKLVFFIETGLGTALLKPSIITLEHLQIKIVRSHFVTKSCIHNGEVSQFKLNAGAFKKHLVLVLMYWNIMWNKLWIWLNNNTFTYYKVENFFDRDRTRTCNLQIRSLMPYPLGHTTLACYNSKIFSNSKLGYGEIIQKLCLDKKYSLYRKEALKGH